MNNAHCYDLVNDKGRPFTAVYEPAFSGQGPEAQPTVAFYDAADENFTYYVDTLMEHRGGLHLHGGVDVWRLSEFNVLDTKAWLLTISS